MNISVIGTVGLPPIYGGFETLTAQMVTHLQGHGDFAVYCSLKSYRARLANYQGAKLVYPAWGQIFNIDTYDLKE